VENFVEPDRPQMTKWRLLIARWIAKAANTHSEYVTLIAFPLQQWLQERASILPYTSVSQRPGRSPVPGPGINYTGPQEVLLEFVILVF